MAWGRGRAAGMHASGRREKEDARKAILLATLVWCLFSLALFPFLSFVHGPVNRLLVKNQINPEGI